MYARVDALALLKSAVMMLHSLCVGGDDPCCQGTPPALWGVRRVWSRELVLPPPLSPPSGKAPYPQPLASEGAPCELSERPRWPKMAPRRPSEPIMASKVAEDNSRWFTAMFTPLPPFLGGRAQTTETKKQNWWHAATDDHVPNHAPERARQSACPKAAGPPPKEHIAKLIEPLRERIEYDEG